MTDKEAYELLLKYSGGEKGIIMIREMIHISGADVAVEYMVKSYNNRGKDVPVDFRQWMTQAFTYMQKEMSKQNN